MKKIIIFLGTSIVVAGIILAFYGNHLLSEQNIYPNVYIQDTNVGRLSKEDAAKLLRTTYDTGEIIFSYKNKSWSYDLEQLGYEYKIDEAIEKAYQIAREGSVISKFSEAFKLTHGGKKKIVLERKENFESFASIFEEIKKQIDLPPVNAKISIGSGILITDEQAGVSVDKQALSDKTAAYLKNPTPNMIEVPVVEEKAKITAEYLKQINGVIGEYHTVFNNSIPGRNHNIRNAASRIDNVLLNPGEQFSFNEKNGSISAASGYVNAPVIVKGELQEGMGGGVCQVSSTLYNSALLSGLQIVERRNHSIPSGYVPIGRDATIFGNLIDLKFKNDKEYPIFIRSYVSGNKVTVAIYGDTSKHPKVTLTSSVSEVVPRSVEKINDPNLPLGKEEVEKSGRDGIRSVTTMTVNGQSRVISRDYYPPSAKKIRVGTAQPRPQPEQPPATPPVPAVPQLPQVPPQPPVQDSGVGLPDENIFDLGN